MNATFFGAMDGATKFVRGDAIAGLLITFINLIAGIIIGVVEKQMPFGEALTTYTVLTIGDGLVSQIPALIISTAAGILVTKSGVSGSAEKAVLGQLGRHPTGMAITSAFLFAMSLLPGIPILPFWLLSGTMGYLAYYLFKHPDALYPTTGAAGKDGKPPQLGEDGKPLQLTGPDGQALPTPDGAKPEEAPADVLHIDALRLELGYGLLPLINYQRGHRLTEQIKALRRQMARELGFIIPSVRIQDNMQLPPNVYVVKVKEIEAARGEIRPDMLLVMNPQGGAINLPGEETTEPTFGLPAMWIPESYREEALFRNFTVVDPPTVVTTHLTEIIKDNLAELLSYTETQKLLDDLGKTQQKLITETIPSLISVSGVQRVLQLLLREMVSIRDLPTIIEAIAEATRNTQNMVMIAEHVRMRLARQLSHANTHEGGYLPIISMSPQWEQAFIEAISGTGDERSLSLAPSHIQEFINTVRTVYEKMTMQGETPVLLTSPTIRPFVRSIIERFRPHTVVMSQNEIHPRARIKTLGQI